MVFENEIYLLRIYNHLKYKSLISNYTNEMRRVAIPLMDDKLSEYFGQCSHYEIFEIDNKTIKSSKVEFHSIKEIEEIPDWVVKKGITDVIAYKMDKKFIALFSNTKINLFVGVPMDTAASLIDSYLNGTLRSDAKIIHELTKDTIGL